MTKHEYMQNPTKLFWEYYVQFATPTIRSMVDGMKNQIIASTDEVFNDIALPLWDRISRAAYQELCNVNFKINGSRSASLSDGVCAAKAYAKTIKEGQQHEND